MGHDVSAYLKADAGHNNEIAYLRRAAWDELAGTIYEALGCPECDGGMRLRMAGWGLGIKDGDYLILPNGSNTTRYQVERISYRADPPDMWFADVVFAPRTSVSAA
jgi:hypothetical protein